MQLAELAAYADEKYHIQEEYKWADFPGFSVLTDPATGRWAALLMRQWDEESGRMIERCDLKCGQQSLTVLHKPYLSPPLRMRGQKWLGIIFNESTEPAVVRRLFDRALTSGEQRGYTLMLASQLPTPPRRPCTESRPDLTHTAAGIYRDTLLPFSDSTYLPRGGLIPEKLREMSRLYEYGRESLEMKAKNFVRQARFMEDYEDDYPWEGELNCYFPAYHDLTVRQLRGYFSWRAKVRKGFFGPLPVSAAYLYVYELLNGIGADSPEDALRKLKAFEAGFPDAGQGDARMRTNLTHWMTEYAVLNDVPPETARQFADPALLKRDNALMILKCAAERRDEDVFYALCRLSGKKLNESPVFLQDLPRGIRLFAEVWRKAAEAFRERGEDLFALCFGSPKTVRWMPLTNALYLPGDPPAERDYALTGCRRFFCRGGDWFTEAYDPQYFDKNRLRGLLHEADRRLRKYLKTGRYLKEDPADAWAGPITEAVIEEDRRAIREAARPKITLDLSGLDRIRRDAVTTRESLLSEEERLAWEEEAPPASPVPEAPDASALSMVAPNAPNLPTKAPASPDLPPNASDLPLDPLQFRILRTLLAGKSPADLIRVNRLMPSLVADTVNELLYDEIGDTVLVCENESLSLVEDYREELEQLLGGTVHG